MEMSDRAANCVLGDKDAGRREKYKLLLGYQTPSETEAGLQFLLWKKKTKKKNLVKRK